MTVEDLIKELEKQDPKLEVRLSDLKPLLKVSDAMSRDYDGKRVVLLK